MEFGEKLQQLRKSRGLTQEDLAEGLYVSRTAVSKWESGRGYPSIDSLKGIAAYFSVTVDDLLSGEKLIAIAETENRSLLDFLFGTVDLLSVLLILLPLYPQAAEGFVYSVSLPAYTQTSTLNRWVYWILFSALILAGTFKILLAHWKTDRPQRIVTVCSLLLSIGAVLLLSLGGQTYAVALTFLLLILKSALLFQKGK